MPDGTTCGAPTGTSTGTTSTTERVRLRGFGTRTATASGRDSAPSSGGKCDRSASRRNDQPRPSSSSTLCPATGCGIRSR